MSSVTAEIENPFAALYNPALLSAQKSSLFSFTTSAATSQYSTLKNVLVDSPEHRTQTAIPTREDMQIPQTQVTLWSLGFTYPFRLPKYINRRAGIGATLSGPYNKLRSFVSNTPYDFYALRYGTSDQQFKATLGTSVEVFPEHFYAGVGLSFFITASGEADAVIISNNPTGRWHHDVGLNSALVAGLFGKWERTQASLVYRQAINPYFEYRITGQGQVDGVDTVKIPFVLSSWLYFEPQMIEPEVQYDFGPIKASVGLSYQLWSQYKPSYLVVDAVDSSQQNRRTQLPSLPFRDTLNPRISIQWPIKRNVFLISAGYQYRPSPVEDLSGSGNIVDSNTHVVGLSLQHHLPANEIIAVPIVWGLFGQYHWIQSRTITKSDPTFIGAPGYEFQGNAYTYGVSLQAEL